MAIIKSIKGIRYNPDKIKDIKTVVAPPYDVISPQMQINLYKSHSNNIVRLILGEKKTDDTENNNRYTRSAADFSEWNNNKILIQDKEPSIYIYSQEYSFNNIKKTRTGFIVGYKLEEFGKGKILPHEDTLAKPKEDRLKLTKACGANFSPIFGLYSDPGDTIIKSFANAQSEQPIIDFTDDTGERHSLWRITDNKIIEQATQALNDKNILIADGHHRYETAVNYRNEMSKKSSNFTGNEAFNYVMMYLTNTDSDGLSVFAIHRVIGGIEGYDKKAFINKLSDYFEIKSFADSNNHSDAERRSHLLKKMEEHEENDHVFGLYCGGEEYLMLTLKNREIIDRLVSNNKSQAWKSLDVSILHVVIIENILGISKESLRDQKNITYRVKHEEAAAAVQNRDAQIALFLNPTSIKQIQGVVTTGEKMPQKSTFFYPKLKSGLVINSLE